MGSSPLPILPSPSFNCKWGLQEPLARLAWSMEWRRKWLSLYQGLNRKQHIQKRLVQEESLEGIIPVEWVEESTVTCYYPKAGRGKGRRASPVESPPCPQRAPSVRRHCGPQVTLWRGSLGNKNPDFTTPLPLLPGQGWKHEEAMQLRNLWCNTGQHPGRHEVENVDPERQM